MTCSGRGTQVAWSLRLITALNMSFHRDSLVLVLFCLCVCVFCLFFLVVVLLLACVFLVAVFFFSHRGIISLACTTNQKLITASASIAEFTQRVNTCITTLREQLRRWSKKKFSATFSSCCFTAFDRFVSGRGLVLRKWTPWEGPPQFGETTLALRTIAILDVGICRLQLLCV